MNLRTKKSIAIEIIYFFSGIFILLIFWAFIEIQNNYFHNKVITQRKENSQLQVQIKRLDKKPMLQPDKLKILNDNAREMNELGSSKEEILTMKDDFFKLFGSKNALSDRIKLKKLKESEKIESEKIKKTYSKILTNEEIFHNIKMLSILLFILLYPARITFILVKWAIKILYIKN